MLIIRIIKVTITPGIKTNIFSPKYMIIEVVITKKRIRSANESNLDPNTLWVLVFLAIYPSKISVNPHIR
ncbi:hypothetical protein D3C81_1734600 [compost metagenome]